MEIKHFEEQYLQSLNELLEEAFDVSMSGKLSKDDVQLIAVSNEVVIGHLLLHYSIDPIRNQKFYFEQLCDFACSTP